MRTPLLSWVIFGKRPSDIFIGWILNAAVRAQNNAYYEIHRNSQTQGAIMAVKLLTATRRASHMTKKAFKRFLLVIGLTAAIAAAFATSIVILIFRAVS